MPSSSAADRPASPRATSSRVQASSTWCSSATGSDRAGQASGRASLNTPNRGLRLPGMAYDGDHPDGFMPRADVVAYLERYAAGQAGEVRTGIEVTMLRAADGGFLLETSVGPIEARAVVTCTGAYQ